ncbi:GNAT family N-acetyltransferase [Sedimentibacter sp. zth1]|nr:GNAT family N-acetyltransferase [Sedimentibacter sp. zth1]
MFDDNIRENRKVRQSFDKLAQKTFGLSFKNWYQNDYWTEKYIPYVLIDGERVVSNVSVNIIDTVWKNEKKQYIQLGTIMTDSEYRGKGLSRLLMEKVLEEWKDKCDAIYLFANDTVLDFYPKFGFVKAHEYQYQISITPKKGVVRKLDMSCTIDRELLFEKYKNSNPFSVLPMVDNVGLLMFYCLQFMKEYVYYVEDCDAVVIAMQDNENLICFDIFCDGESDINDILAITASDDITNVVFGFSPKEIINCRPTLLQEDDTTLFVFSSKENIFVDNKLMFPLLSHA